MKMTHRQEPFVCPECGSEEAASPGPGEARNPGRGRRRSRVCARCHFEIPAHLAERWGGISAEEAGKEWREVYRDSAAQPADAPPRDDSPHSRDAAAQLGSEGGRGVRWSL